MKILKWLDEWLFPRFAVCMICGQNSHGEALCIACRQEIGEGCISGDLCPLCGHRLGPGPCTFCRGDVPGKMASVWPHAGIPRKLVHLLKYDCQADAAKVVAPFLADRARRMDLPTDTVVTWVAMPDKRQRMRGIDHGRTLAEAVAAELGISCRGLLQRSRKAHTQRGLGLHARLRNLEGAFVCPEKLEYPVLLVDDVMTSSATARACAAALLGAGAPRVFILTVTQA